MATKKKNKENTGPVVLASRENNLNSKSLLVPPSNAASLSLSASKEGPIVNLDEEKKKIT
jgi:hypothetical protein